MKNPALNIPVTFYQSVVPRMFSGAGIMTHAYSEIHVPKVLTTILTKATPLSTTNQNQANATTENELLALNHNRHQPTLSNIYDDFSSHFFHLLIVPRGKAASWGKYFRHSKYS